MSAQQFNVITPAICSTFQNEQVKKIGSSIFVAYERKHHHHDSPHRLMTYSTSTSPLGSGAFGTVYPVGVAAMDYRFKQLTYTNKQKVVKVMHDVNPKKKAQILKEFEMGQKASHLGMKKPVFEGPEGNQTCYLVMNHLQGAELEDSIYNDAVFQLSLNKKKELLYKLLKAAYEQCEKVGIVHRDIKPDNIMVELVPEIKVNIIDYGLAKGVGTNDGRFPGTGEYAAPEMKAHREHGSKCDVYSMGRIFYFLRESDNYSSESLYWQDWLGKLIDQMLDDVPDYRPSFTEVMKDLEQHFPYLSPAPLIEHEDVSSRRDTPQFSAYNALKIAVCVGAAVVAGVASLALAALATAAFLGAIVASAPVLAVAAAVGIVAASTFAGGACFFAKKAKKPAWFKCELPVSPV